MQLKGKNILLISPEPWDHIFVSKHHYAIHLGRRNCQVYFLNPPSSKKEILKTGYPNVWEVNYAGFPKGLRFFPTSLQRYYIKKSFKAIQRLCKLEFDIIWSFDNSVFFDFGAMPEDVVKISHIVDLNQDFQTEKAASTADICICTTELIKKRLLQFNKNVYKINHGLSLRKTEFIASLPGVNKVKAMYVGNLAMPFLDWQCFDMIASSNRTIDFILIGSGKDEVCEEKNWMHLYKVLMHQRENVYFLDKVPSEQIHAYLSVADVLLVTYQDNHHKDQANPHKMMEYLSSGKMIVATKTEEYAALAKQGLFLMSNQNKEFSYLFETAIQNLEKWNSIEKQKLRQTFALENTYDKQIDRIEGLLADGKTS